MEEGYYSDDVEIDVNEVSEEVADAANQDGNDGQSDTTGNGTAGEDDEE